MKVSIIIPCLHRHEQTKKTLEKIFTAAKELDTPYEIIISDSSEDTALESYLRQFFGDQFRYTRPSKPGVATGKNQGAKVATGDILIFCDSDIEVEKETLQNVVAFLVLHPTVGAVGGKVLWEGGPKDKTPDRPRPEDRMKKIGETVYTEAIYSRFLATYKAVFEAVGGYDEEVFNMRGEGSDLSIRYWQQGFPLAYEEHIVVHHIFHAPDAIGIRISNEKEKIARDYVLLGYKYDCFQNKNSNFTYTVQVNLDESSMQFFETFGRSTEFLEKLKPILDRQKSQFSPLYPFHFLDIFSDEVLFQECIREASGRIKKFAPFP